MQAIRSRDTRPELLLRRELHQRGLRYRVATRPVPTLRRTADVVFTRWRVAVFVDGCFWHACPVHSRMPTVNEHYWSPKLARNVARDAETTSALTAAGWTVLRFWEHENIADIADAVEAAVRDAQRRAAHAPLGQSQRATPPPGVLA